MINSTVVDEVTSPQVSRGSQGLVTSSTTKYLGPDTDGAIDDEQQLKNRPNSLRPTDDGLHSGHGALPVCKVVRAAFGRTDAFERFEIFVA